MSCVFVRLNVSICSEWFVYLDVASGDEIISYSTLCPNIVFFNIPGKLYYNVLIYRLGVPESLFFFLY